MAEVRIENCPSERLNLECRSEMCCTLEIRDAKNRPKFRVCAASHNFVELYLRN